MREWSPFRAYGREYPAFCWQNVVTLAIIAGALLWFCLEARASPAYRWNWSSLADFLIIRDSAGGLRPGLLLQGLFTTLRAGFWTFLFSILVGGAAGLIAADKPLAFFLPYQLCINLLRNTPPIIILFCVYFIAGNVFPLAPLLEKTSAWPPWLQGALGVLAPPGQMDSLCAAVFALGLYQAAYVAEIIRGSVESVPKSQWDSALALGFGHLSALRLVIFPQALRLALPPLTGQCVTTFKESSLASLISLPDLTFQSLEIMATSGMTFEVWLTAGALYLIIGLFCSAIGRFLELRSPHHAR